MAIITNILVDEATRVVLMAGNDLSHAQIDAQYTTWTVNHKPTASFIVYENVTLPLDGYLDECYTYSVQMVWAIVPGKEQEVYDEIYGSSAAPVNVHYHTNVITTNSGTSVRVDVTIEWEEGIPGDIRYELQYRTKTYVMPEEAGGQPTYAYGQWSSTRETHGLSLTIEDIVSGDYEGQIKGVDLTGTSSPWVVFEFTADQLDSSVPNCTGLELYGQGDSAIFLATDVPLRWFKVTTTEVSDAYGPAGATQPGTWFRYYELKIKNMDDTIRRVEYLIIEEYTYNFNMNYTDGNGVPERHLKFELRAISTWGGISTIPAILTVSNPSPPAVTGFYAFSFLGSFDVTWEPSEELDIAGYVLHASQVNGFTPDEGNLINNGPETSRGITKIPYLPNLDYVPSGNWYFRVAAYDAFGPFDLDYGVQKSVVVNSIDMFDTVPPPIASFTLETALDRSALTSSSNIRVLWTPITDVDGDFASYLVKYRRDGETIYTETRIEGLASNTVLLTGFTPGVRYYFKMGSVDKWSNQSQWGAESYITAALDETVPTTPTFTLDIGLKKLIIKVTPSAQANHGGFEVYVSTTPGFAPDVSGYTNRIAKEPSTLFGYDGAADTTYYVSVRAYSTSGIFSVFAAEQNAKSMLLQKLDIAARAVDSAQIAVDAIKGDVIAANAITVTKIADDAIESPKIKAGAIIAGKIATDAVTANTIEANAVTAGKINADAITARELAANSVTAEQIKAYEISSDKITTGEFITLSAQIKALTVTTGHIVSLTADKIDSGSISASRYINVGPPSGNAKIQLDGINNRIVVTDENAYERVVIGKQSTGYYGMTLKNASGTDVFRCRKTAAGADEVWIGNLTAGTINASLVSITNLTVGTNVAMGSNATITWSQISNPPAAVTLPSYITTTKITQTTIESPNITGGTITGTTVQTVLVGATPTVECTRLTATTNDLECWADGGSGTVTKIGTFGLNSVNEKSIIMLDRTNTVNTNNGYFITNMRSNLTEGISVVAKVGDDAKLVEPYGGFFDYFQVAMWGSAWAEARPGDNYVGLMGTAGKLNSTVRPYGYIGVYAHSEHQYGLDLACGTGVQSFENCFDYATNVPDGNFKLPSAALICSYSNTRTVLAWYRHSNGHRYAIQAGHYDLPTTPVWGWVYVHNPAAWCENNRP